MKRLTKKKTEKNAKDIRIIFLSIIDSILFYLTKRTTDEDEKYVRQTMSHQIPDFKFTKIIVSIEKSRRPTYSHMHVCKCIHSFLYIYQLVVI